MKYEGDNYYNLGGYFELYNSPHERMPCFFCHLFTPLYSRLKQLFFCKLFMLRLKVALSFKTKN